MRPTSVGFTTTRPRPPPVPAASPANALDQKRSGLPLRCPRSSMTQPLRQPERVGGRNAFFSPRRAKPGAFLLRGLVRCGHCGIVVACHQRPASKKSDAAWNRYYYCRNHDPIRAGGEHHRCRNATFEPMRSMNSSLTRFAMHCCDPRCSWPANVPSLLEHRHPMIRSLPSSSTGSNARQRGSIRAATSR